MLTRLEIVHHADAQCNARLGWEERIFEDEDDDEGRGRFARLRSCTEYPFTLGSGVELSRAQPKGHPRGKHAVAGIFSEEPRETAPDRAEGVRRSRSRFLPPNPWLENAKSLRI